MSDDYRQQMMRIADDLHGQGVGRYTSAPPFYRAAWRLGFRIRPPLYQTFAELAIGMGTGFGLGWGLLAWILVWGPEGRPVTDVIVATLVGGVSFGLIMAAYYRWKAHRLRLPPLR
jgi:hypothetical protein